MNTKNYYENPKTLHIGCEENRAYFIPFSDRSVALSGIAEFDRLYGDKNYTAIHWEQWLPTLSRRPNSLFHSSFTDMLTERLRHFLLSGNSKLRGVYMKALCELIKTMSLDKALNIADEAAGQAFEEIGDILQLAGV